MEIESGNGATAVSGRAVSGSAENACAAAHLLLLLVALAEIVVEEHAQLKLHVELQKSVALCIVAMEGGGAAVSAGGGRRQDACDGRWRDSRSTGSLMRSLSSAKACSYSPRWMPMQAWHGEQAQPPAPVAVGGARGAALC